MKQFLYTQSLNTKTMQFPCNCQDPETGHSSECFLIKDVDKSGRAGTLPCEAKRMAYDRPVQFNMFRNNAFDI